MQAFRFGTGPTAPVSCLGHLDNQRYGNSGYKDGGGVDNHCQFEPAGNAFGAVLCFFKN